MSSGGGRIDSRQTNDDDDDDGRIIVNDREEGSPAVPAPACMMSVDDGELVERKH
jgi:hypothetical protein